MKGIYLYFQLDGIPHYEYPPLDLNEDEFDKWKDNITVQMEKKIMNGFQIFTGF